MLSNIFFGLAVQATVLVAAVLTIPFLLSNLGADRFGVIALALAFLGYFSFFDLGIGRALTLKVATYLEIGELNNIISIFWGAMLLLIFISGGCAFIIYLIVPWISQSVLTVPKDLYIEVNKSLYILALSIPVVVLSSGLRGVLEGLGQFNKVNLVRVPVGILTFLLPLYISNFTNKLDIVIISLLMIRLLGLFAQLVFCIKALPGILKNHRINLVKLKTLLTLSYWMAISNSIGPFLVYLDRFVVGSVITLKAVSIYVVPYEIVTKLWIVVGSVTTVIFPAFAAASQGGQSVAATLCSWSIKITFLLLCPLTLLIILVSPELLKYWLDASFSSDGAKVMRWLALGVFINSFGQIYFTLLQGMGHSNFTAKLYFFELPLYVIVIYILTNSLGVEGTAISWTLRVILDTGILCFYSRKYVKVLPQNKYRLLVPSLFIFLTFLIANFVDDVETRVVVLIISELFIIPIGWFLIFDKKDRDLILKICISFLLKIHFLKHFKK